MNTITQTIKQIIIELTEKELEQLIQGVQISDVLCGDDSVTVRVRKQKQERPPYKS